jgi:predicted regulator of Ras-like GTPase activity (Roadblock/LC7/MglB family)
MNKEAYAVALTNALTEIRNVCPDVQTSFLFDKDATLVAGDSEAPEATLHRVVGSLEGILNKSDTLGGLNSLAIEGSRGNVHISCVNDHLYLTMVTSKDADMRYVETVARVLIPTVMKLLDSLNPTPLRQFPPSHSLKSEVEDDSDVEPSRDYEEEELNEELAEELESDADEVETKELSVQSDMPSNQLIVESFGGLLVRSDTVQIGKEITSQWKELLDGKNVELVEIESFNGKTSQCKVKSLDDSKLDNKAVIRIPEKLCQTLDIKKGELVRVKPVTR